MEYRRLGRSGLNVSALSFGSWVTFGDQVDDDVAFECMKAAFDAGINFFDNAEIYAHGKSEEVMGRLIKRGGWRRTDLVISTKIFWGGFGPNDQGLSRKRIREGTEAALRRLDLDYVDLIFCHRPDPYTPIEETVRAMSWVVDRGLALYWGTSEWSAEQIRQAHHVAREHGLTPPTMEQPQYHMLHRERVEREYANLYTEFGLGTTIWSPLARGVLAGRYDDGIPAGSRFSLENYAWLRDEIESDEGKRRLAKVRALKPIADDLGMTRAQLALAWCLANPNVSTVITGASSLAQLRENLGALDHVAALTPEVLERIETVLDNRPEPVPDFRRSE